MNPSSIIVILCTIVSLVCATDVNKGRDIFCARANVTEVRIQGCDSEPCTIKKGVKVPIEIDFSFEAPKSTNEINFSVFAAYWNIPGTGAYGSNIATGRWCEQLKLRSCPAVALRRYTLKSQLYADLKLESTVGGGSTGEVSTVWMLTPIDRKESGPNESSQCSFTVLINLTN